VTQTLAEKSSFYVIILCVTFHIDCALILNVLDIPTSQNK